MNNYKGLPGELPAYSRALLNAYSAISDQLRVVGKISPVSPILTDRLRTSPSITAEPNGCYPVEHATRSVAYALLIANKLGLPVEYLNSLISAIFHDIGKSKLSPSLLDKPGKLTEKEFKLVKDHTLIGHHMLPPIGYAREFALSHHERWDGKGYPHSLGGDNIPLLVRIFSVADSLDAMVSDRKYGKVQDLDTALKELIAESGTQFWPDAVNAMVELSNNGQERGIEQVIAGEVGSALKLLH